MKLIFATDGGNQFEIEVGDNDSLPEIKEKVKTKQGIPISDQTLIFNGNIIRDELDLIYAEIKDGSLIHLQIAENPKMPDFHDHQFSPPPEFQDSDFSQFLNQFNFPNPTPPREISITLKMPTASDTVNVKADVNETIQQLKEKIEQRAGTPIRRIVIKHKNGTELVDDMTLLDCRISLNPEVTVELRPPPPKMDLQFQMPGSNDVITVETCVEDTVQQLKEKIHGKEGTPISQISIKDENGVELDDHKTLNDCAISLDSGITVEFLALQGIEAEAEAEAHRKKRKTMQGASQPAAPPTPTRTARAASTMSIVLKYRGARLTTEVKAAHKVSELKTKLKTLRLQIPEECFFVHRQNVMDEQLSFASHSVAKGDLIQIFPGRVTGGH
ncbi:hypothetical protein C2S51_024543 [Perilla frutescens var. frutescens]|nr:hypothetical protein C2S51_024543 [Perilla frutescens var. frutescens]